MATYLRASAPQDGAASVVITAGPSGKPRARIEWGILARPSPIAGQTVGATLPVPIALEAAEKGRARAIVERVVVVIDDPALWDEAWGELREP